MARYEEQSENRGHKTVYYYYVVDDGWHLPYEVIEQINYRIRQSQKAALNKVIRQNRMHKGGWITKEVAEKYAAKSWVYRVLYSGQYIKEVRQFGQELQELYGLTECEAINIMNGRNVSDTIARYDRIKNMIPVRVNQQGICDDIAGEYLHKAI